MPLPVASEKRSATLGFLRASYAFFGYPSAVVMRMPGSPGL
jgi:hypothetical protein